MEMVCVSVCVCSSPQQELISIKLHSLASFFFFFVATTNLRREAHDPNNSLPLSPIHVLLRELLGSKLQKKKNCYNSNIHGSSSFKYNSPSTVTCTLHFWSQVSRPCNLHCPHGPISHAAGIRQPPRLVLSDSRLHRERASWIQCTALPRAAWAAEENAWFRVVPSWFANEEGYDSHVLVPRPECGFGPLARLWWGCYSWCDWQWSLAWECELQRWGHEPGAL